MPDRLRGWIAAVGLAVAVAVGGAACGSAGKSTGRPPGTAPVVREALTVRYASTDGRFVGLSDGTLWNIDWGSAGHARGLRPGTPVRVGRSGRGDFPFQMTTPEGRQIGARLGKRLD